jgi:hypothetical protein
MKPTQKSFNSKNINLLRLTSIAKDNFKLISWAFSNRKKEIIDQKKQYWFPIIQMMTGDKNHTRNSKNGYAHLYCESEGYIRLSTMAGIDIDNDEITLTFYIPTLSNSENLDFFLYYSKLKKCLVKIKWKNGLKDYFKNQIESDIEVEYSTINLYYLDLEYRQYIEVIYKDEIPKDYKPICLYKNMEISPNTVGAHKRKVILLEENSFKKFDSLKSLFEYLQELGLKCKDYNTFKTMKSQNKNYTVANKQGHFEEDEFKQLSFRLTLVI